MKQILLTELLTKITALPWQRTGILIEGSQRIPPFMPRLIASVEHGARDGGGEMGADDLHAVNHAAYLAHAANALPEVLEALECSIEIIENLQAMERAAGQLDQSGWPTNHPLIDMNLTKFLRDIRFARESVERDPPNFLLAGPLMGACVYCHGGR